MMMRCRWLLPQASDEGEAEEDFGTSSCASTQRHLWNLFENPHHSRAAKVSLPGASLHLLYPQG